MRLNRINHREFGVFTCVIVRKYSVYISYIRWCSIIYIAMLNNTSSISCCHGPIYNIVNILLPIIGNDISYGIHVVPIGRSIVFEDSSERPVYIIECNCVWWWTRRWYALGSRRGLTIYKRMSVWIRKWSKKQHALCSSGDLRCWRTPRRGWVFSYGAYVFQAFIYQVPEFFGTIILDVNSALTK